LPQKCKNDISAEIEQKYNSPARRAPIDRDANRIKVPDERIYLQLNRCGPRFLER
jgi:hypothetical protein